MVYGATDPVQASPEALDRRVNTVLVERLNNSFRQHMAALRRRTMSPAKTAEGLRAQAVLFQGYYNFCLPHWRLRLPLAEPQPTKGNGSQKKWQRRTPAMAAGIADHIWTIEELLLFQVPPGNRVWQAEREENEALPPTG